MSPDPGGLDLRGRAGCGWFSLRRILIFQLPPVPCSASMSRRSVAMSRLAAFASSSVMITQLGGAGSYTNSAAAADWAALRVAGYVRVA